MIGQSGCPFLTCAVIGQPGVGQFLTCAVIGQSGGICFSPMLRLVSLEVCVLTCAVIGQSGGIFWRQTLVLVVMSKQ